MLFVSLIVKPSRMIVRSGATDVLLCQSLLFKEFEADWKSCLIRPPAPPFLYGENFKISWGKLLIYIGFLWAGVLLLSD